jgi:CheY-like chemotaxis protein
MPILVVDDEAEIRFLISELLSEEGYTVVQAANGREALIYLQRVTPLPHTAQHDDAAHAWLGLPAHPAP